MPNERGTLSFSIEEINCSQGIFSSARFQKIFIPPKNSRLLEIPRGRGLSKAKIFKGKYEPGGRFKPKKTFNGTEWIFLGTVQ